MVFSSLTFLFFFLPAVLLLNFIAPLKIKNYILLIFSLIFYAWGGPTYLLLMIFSVFINYIFGLLIGSTSTPTPRKKLRLASGVGIKIDLLGYYK